MTNPSDQEPNLSAEIERSLGSIWQRRTGVRPTSISAEVRGDAVRCAIQPGEPEAADAAVDDEPDEDRDAGGSDSYSFRIESIAAVTKITHRTVSAFINTEDAKKGTAQQTFIFERVRTKY
jgi:hypothetical protein